MPNLITKQPPQKILIIKLCCLGDIIFLTPMLRALRQQYPLAHITLLASSWVRDIAAQITFVDEIIIFDAPFENRFSFSSIIKTLNLVRQLRKQKFDILITGHRNKMFAMLGMISRIPMRIGFADKSSPFITHPIFFQANEHEIKRYLSLLTPLDIHSTSYQTEISPPVQETEIAQELLSRWGFRDEDIIVSIIAGGGENPGTLMPIKRWDTKCYSEFCERILRADNTKILLLGGVNDRQVNETIIAGCNTGKDRLVNVAGSITLRTLPALLQHSRIAIGGDTGPTHLAAAVGIPTLFLFGPSDPRLVAPMISNSLYLWKHVSCSPCYTPDTVMQKKYFKGKQFICWTQTQECLKTLTVDEVFSVYTKLLMSIP